MSFGNILTKLSSLRDKQMFFFLVFLPVVLAVVLLVVVVTVWVNCLFHDSFVKKGRQTWLCWFFSLWSILIWLNMMPQFCHRPISTCDGRNPMWQVSIWKGAVLILVVAVQPEVGIRWPSQIISRSRGASLHCCPLLCRSGGSEAGIQKSSKWVASLKHPSPGWVTPWTVYFFFTVCAFSCGSLMHTQCVGQPWCMLGTERLPPAISHHCLRHYVSSIKSVSSSRNVVSTLHCSQLQTGVNWSVLNHGVL